LLGPEQLNITPRLAPLTLESSAAITVSEKIAREIGLSDNQVVRGVIAARGGLMKLLVNDQELDWASNKKFKSGDSIDFRVRTTAQGALLLPLSIERAKPSKTSNSPTNSRESSRFLTLLHRPDAGAIQSEFFKPGIVRESFVQGLDSSSSQALAQMMHRMRGISPGAVRDAFLRSGLFGELFLKTHVSVPIDIKQLMRKLLLVSKVSGSDKGSIEEIIDEIESRQLEALQAQKNHQISYHFMMPFVDANPVKIHFQRDAIGLDKEAPNWVINLHAETDSIGSLWLKSIVTPDFDIEMTLWAERLETAKNAERAASSLEKSLADFGLKLAKLSILNAARPTVDAAFSAPGHVLDIKT